MPVLPTHALGQSEIDIRALCIECVISQTLETTIGASSDPEAIIFGMPIRLTEQKDGSLLLLTLDGGPPRVFDRKGAFLRQIGRRGRGPLEFLRPSHALEVPGDSLLILDVGQARALVVASDGGNRTVLDLPSVLEIDILEWPHAISVADIRTAEGIGIPFHALDFSGSTVLATAIPGTETYELRPMQGPQVWSVQAVDDSLFWAVGGPNYMLELWNEERGREVQLRRPLPEYDPENRNGMGNPSVPPPARVISSLVDSDGLIWVFLQVPRYDWRGAWTEVPISPRGEIHLKDAPDLPFGLYQTRVDVIDPGLGALVYSTLIPTLAVPFTHLSSPAIAKYRLAEDGTPLVEVWSLELKRPSH